ncbi:hypothetical protein BKA67DRAFT_537159 [Truncatella angustata]|uniref:Uncharacterized protein n=1 Tax=Truncatella angustata TaxID=152316 RepID=A0A9P8UJU0_9PEZI|nr:uncharacterized protein BKA67DRAFT_537159 [Truncatella angustata]KAH6653484.1 hypothetical protein BKA67DRAFT_537159 [Truncatella angustata]
MSSKVVLPWVGDYRPSATGTAAMLDEMIHGQEQGSYKWSRIPISRYKDYVGLAVAASAYPELLSDRAVAERSPSDRYRYRSLGVFPRFGSPEVDRWILLRDRYRWNSGLRSAIARREP